MLRRIVTRGIITENSDTKLYISFNILFPEYLVRIQRQLSHPFLHQKPSKKHNSASLRDVFCSTTCRRG